MPEGGSRGWLKVLFGGAGVALFAFAAPIIWDRIDFKELQPDYVQTSLRREGDKIIIFVRNLSDEPLDLIKARIVIAGVEPIDTNRLGTYPEEKLYIIDATSNEATVSRDAGDLVVVIGIGKPSHQAMPTNFRSSYPTRGLYTSWAPQLTANCSTSAVTHTRLKASNAAMKRHPLALAFALLFLATPAHAFEECKQLPAATLLREDISRLIMLWTPARYLDEFRAIQLLIPEQSDALIPYAAFDAHGRPFVQFSLEFYRVLCRFVLAAAYIEEHANFDALNSISYDTARCLQRRDSFRTCLTTHALALETQFESEYAGLSDQEKDAHKQLLTDALAQIVLHEYAHIFLDHHRLIQRKELSRVDAEFQADLFAITHAAEGGFYPWALAYCLPDNV